MKKLSVCILFGGTGPGREDSLRSAQALLNSIDKEKYNLFPVGITENGDWVLFGGSDYAHLSDGTWEHHDSNRRAAISPVRGQGLLSFEGDCVVRERIDVAFPVIHGEDAAIQSLLKLAGIPFVGPGTAASALAKSKTLSKLVMEAAGVPCAHWHLVRRSEVEKRMNDVTALLENRLGYPMLVKPAAAGGMVDDRNALEAALRDAAAGAEKILVEEYIPGREIQVAVMGNDSPVASVCGENCCVPARISEDTEEQIRDLAVKGYQAMGCKGLSRVDFLFVEEGNRIMFKEIHTVPGFSDEAMYPRLFAASGISRTQLIDELLKLAQEDVE